MVQWILKDTMLVFNWQYVQNLTKAETRNESIELEQHRFMKKCTNSYGENLTITPAVNFETDEYDYSDLFLIKLIKHLQAIYLLRRSLLNIVVT